MEPEGKEELVRRILELEVDVYRALRPIVPGEWLRADLTMPQLKVLLLLYIDGPTRMTEIARGLGVTLATATGVIDRLVERNLVVREPQPGDRRVVMCELSEEGRKLISQDWESGQSQITSILESMTTPQLELVAKALGLILDAARAASHNAPHPFISQISQEA